MSEDQRLLHEYVALESREALEELIRKHLALVYSAALRQVRDSHLAEDVTQAVFLVLSQKAKSIRNGVAVGGWLLSVTRYVSVNAMKKQSIHRTHEELAARPEIAQANESWDDVADQLDEELNSLASLDRDAIVLRFFQDRSFTQIGAELGMSADAARKRVSRALDRLRGRLARRVPSITAVALSGAIASRGVCAVSAIPNHLMAGTLAACAGNPTPYCVLLSKGAIKMIAWTKAKLVGALAACVLFGGTGVVMMSQAVGQEAPPATPAATATPAPAVEQVVVREAQADQPATTAEPAVVVSEAPSNEAATGNLIIVTSRTVSESGETGATLQNVTIYESVNSEAPSTEALTGNVILHGTLSPSGETGTGQLTLQNVNVSESVKAESVKVENVTVSDSDAQSSESDDSMNAPAADPDPSAQP